MWSNPLYDLYQNTDLIYIEVLTVLTVNGSCLMWEDRNHFYLWPSPTAQHLIWALNPIYKCLHDI